MLQYDVFRAITRRALSINYVSPSVCELLSISSGSGSGSGVASVLNMLPVTRKAGPETLSASVTGSDATFTWSSQPYAFSYNLYLSDASSEGPFVLQTSNVFPTSFVLNLTPGVYYAKVTLVEPDFGESFPSPTIQIVIL